MIEANAVMSNLEKNYILKILKQGKRIDGRGFLDYREIRIETNFVPKAEGSADVYLGDTRVMCGIKYDVGKPFSDNPDKGVATVMAEFTPIASPLFEPGRPGEDSIQMARVVDRGIRHTDCIDYDRLCIKAGEFVYIIFVDCYMMDNFGNMTDAAAIAAIAALLSAKLPNAKLDENGQPVWDGTYFALPIHEIPLSITFSKIGDYVIADPDLTESLVEDGSIAFACDEKQQITSIQKYGNATWNVDEILEYSKKAIEIAADLRTKLNLRQYVPEV
ncbi:MAG: exosome complex protein Rrp42 [Promethearchaeota archaeon]